MTTSTPWPGTPRPGIGEPDPDAAARRSLRRYRRVATGLLVGMAALAVAGYALGRGFWPGLLQATAKAGLIGGLADWFAVTALFRHPLGLPIPHTAILPAQKERLGRALGNFIANHVFTEADIERALVRLDMPGLLARLLADPENGALAGRACAAALPHLLDRLEDGRAGELLARAMQHLLSGETLAPVIARVLRALVEGDRHQEVLSFLLAELKSVLRAKEESLRVMIEERVREQGGRLIGWAIGGSIATRVMSAMSQELDRTDPANSDLREAFTVWVRREIDRIETDPERARELGDGLRGLFGHQSVRSWGQDIWQRARQMIEADLERPDGWVVLLVADAGPRLGAMLNRDQAARLRTDATVRRAALRLLPGLRERMAGFIGAVVGGWDARLITDKLELRVGRDLQYVRVNGTLVGALVGGLFYMALRAMFGAVQS
ncbi:DUF445 domain-containing protein [Lichenicoccus sp.]|uniref:DUF445 domain-containing protein n=1 Tax=Lichenicoccus sp. TaxID=2781899 RepID=UPI003D125292